MQTKITYYQTPLYLKGNYVFRIYIIIFISWAAETNYQNLVY